MRILALSDVHGNMRVVRRLREQEADRFDLVVVAGDVGLGADDRAGQVLATLATFRCPVLHVLGNHDSQVSYDRDFGPTCHHLHHRVFEHGGVAFVGYSGLSAHWGLNPLAQELEAEIAHRHAEVTALAAEVDEAERVEVARIEAESVDRLRRLHTDVGDRRAKAYRDGAARIASEREAELVEVNFPSRRLRQGEDWLAKERDERNFNVLAIARNRAVVAEMATQLGQRRCVVVTHERQTRTNVDMPDVPLFLFGHVHGHSDKAFRKSRYVNVSALDDQAGGPFGAGPEAQARMGTYAVIEILEDISVECRRLNLSMDSKSPFYGGTSSLSRPAPGRTSDA